MATTEDTRANGATAGAREFRVLMRMLLVAGATSEEELEQLSIDVLEAIEADPATQPLGIATACEFNPAAIIIDFDVEAESLSEVHGQIGLVITAVEQRMPIEIIDGWSDTATPSDRELVAA